MADPLDSPKSLLSFAREDIRKLNRNSRLFSTVTHIPTSFITIRSPDTIFRLTFRDRIPSRLSRDVCNIALELRNALDQVGFAIAALDGSNPSSGTYFPFSRSAAMGWTPPHTYGIECQTGAVK
ncbi:MAG: hypothetical protein IPF84_13845 [Proteobacteria bacterium]|nr:hypothetical protein [Pseudomonadota bacterium]